MSVGNMNVEVSVIMSVYNDQSNVSSSIKSILDQTFKNFEFLILDDNSTDSTFEKIKKFEEQDDRIKVFRNIENEGLTKSLNTLLRNASSKLIARQDSDDLSLPNRLQLQVNEIKTNNYDAIYTRAINKQNKKKIPGISYYIPSKILIRYKNPFIHGTLMIKKEVIKSLNYYEEAFYYAQDYKLAWELYKNNYKIRNLNKALYVLNTKNNLSEKFRNEQNYYANCVRKQINPN